MSEATANVASAATTGQTSSPLFGHPRGLTFLVMTGMWENSALFGMRTVLIYYLVKQLHLPTTEAVNIYALFSASSLLGLFGGFAADRYLGLRRAVMIGIVLMAVGLFAMTLPPLLIPALIVIAAGNGLVRPTLAAQVGLLYAADDPRRDRAFTHYYVGCNIGAVLAPFIFGTVGELYGWHWAFPASGLGMLIAIVAYTYRWSLMPNGQIQSQVEKSEAGAAVHQRNSLLTLGLVWLAGVLFWAAYGQIGSTIALWADESVNRTVGPGTSRFEFPATWFQSVNPLFIFAFAPLVAWLSSRRKERHSVAAELRKLGIGVLLMAGAFVILAGAAGASEDGSTSWIWVILALAPFTLAELYFVPIGIGLFSRLALKGYVALFVSLWSVAMMMGNAASGWLGHLWVPLQPASFFAVAAVTVSCALLLLPIAAWFSRRDPGRSKS